jgi:hypothetical protein
MSGENPFLKPPASDSSAQASPQLIEVINAISALLTEQRRFDQQAVTKFKKLFGDSGLKWWIIGAGVGGAVELLRLVADIGRWMWCHFH